MHHEQRAHKLHKRISELQLEYLNDSLDLFLNLNLKSKLNDSILITTFILGKPLVHDVVGLSRVVQVIQVVKHH
jgi:hypothetical protein